MQLTPELLARLTKNLPVPGDAHVNTPLTNISVAYLQAAKDFVATQVFPVVPVSKQSDSYYIFDRGDFLRDEAKVRAPGRESAGGGFRLSTDNYNAVVEEFHMDIPDQLRKNADSVLQLDRAATEFVTQKLAIRRELRFMQRYFVAGVWTTDITPGTLWSAANSTPRANVDTGRIVIKSRTGMMPNTLLLGIDVLMALRSNADVRDQFKYVSAESIDENMLARYFGVERVLVTTAVYATSAEGQATATAFAGGKHALLCYAAPSPSLMMPSAGYTFSWNEYAGSLEGIAIQRLRADLLKSDRIEGAMAHDQKVVAAELGYFFQNVVA